MPKEKDLSYIDRYQSFADKLVRFYREPGKTELSPDEQHHWNRINAADDLLRQLYPLKTVVRLLTTKFPELSTSTAYQDVALAKKIFGYKNPNEKQYIERIMVEKLLKMLGRAMLNDDGRAVAAISKEIREWVGKDTDIDPKLIRGNTFVFNLGGGKAIELETTEDVPSTVLDTIMDDGDIFSLDDQEFLKKLKD